MGVGGNPRVPQLTWGSYVPRHGRELLCKVPMMWEEGRNLFHSGTRERFLRPQHEEPSMLAYQGAGEGMP